MSYDEKSMTEVHEASPATFRPFRHSAVAPIEIRAVNHVDEDQTAQHIDLRLPGTPEPVQRRHNELAAAGVPRG